MAVADPADFFGGERRPGAGTEALRVELVGEVPPDEVLEQLIDAVVKLSLAGDVTRCAIILTLP